MEKERNEVNKKELINLITEECRYHRYEVEDVYNATISVLRRLVLERRVVPLGGILTIDYKEPITTYRIPSNGAVRMKLKPSKIFNRKIANVYLGKSTIDEELALSYGEQPEDAGESRTFEEQQEMVKNYKTGQL